VSSLFITATDTDAGKSFLTASMLRALLSAGHDAVALKPVSCGCENGELNADVATLLDAQGMTGGEAGRINLYDFAAYAAPLFAARAEGGCIDATRLAEWCRRQVEGHALTLIEGVGGLMVPLAEGVLVSDWLQLMPQAHVLLVVRARLGGINQALLTLDKLHRMQRRPDWVVVNAADAQGNGMLDDHCAAIAPYLDEGSQLLQLPYLPEPGQAEHCLRKSPLFAGLEGMLHGVQLSGQQGGSHAGIDR